MGTAGALPVVLTFLLVFVALRVFLSFNKDLLRARAWGPLARRSMPFALLALMAASLPLVQDVQDEAAPLMWALAFGVALVVGDFFSMPLDERRAPRAFRSEG